MDRRTLHPFRALLTGSVLVAGAASGEVVTALRQTAEFVAAGVVQADGRYDAVVLIAPAGEDDAWDGRLGEAVTALKPDGRLILVVENGLSLSRAASRPGTGGTLDLFASENRPAVDGSGPPTRRDVRDRLAERGLTQQEWWFPFPSHRFALSLVSARGLAPDERVFDPGFLAAESAAFDPSVAAAERPALRRAWAGAARAGLLGDFAPAFAVAASATALPADDRLALHFGHRRRPAFDKAVSFARRGEAIRVSRAPLHPGLPRSVEGVTNRFPEEAYIPGVPWQAALRAQLADDGWTLAGLVAWASVWWDAVRTLHARGADLALGTPLPGGAVDAIPRNLLHRDGQPVFIDAEWEIETLCAGHLLVRGLVNALTDVEVCGVPGPGLGASLLPLVRAVAEGLGLRLDGATLDEALARESRFQTIVSGIATSRDRAWLAAARLPIRPAPPAFVDPFAERDQALARLEADVAALRVEGERRVAALTEELEESRLRTDRVIRYAAELDRERGRLAVALGEAQDRVDRLETAARKQPARSRYRTLTGAVGAVFAARRGRGRDDGAP